MSCVLIHKSETHDVWLTANTETPKGCIGMAPFMTLKKTKHKYKTEDTYALPYADRIAATSFGIYEPVVTTRNTNQSMPVEVSALAYDKIKDYTMFVINNNLVSILDSKLHLSGIAGIVPGEEYLLIFTIHTSTQWSCVVYPPDDILNDLVIDWVTVDKMEYDSLYLTRCSNYDASRVVTPVADDMSLYLITMDNGKFLAHEYDASGNEDILIDVKTVNKPNCVGKTVYDWYEHKSGELFSALTLSNLRTGEVNVLEPMGSLKNGDVIKKNSSNILVVTHRPLGDINKLLADADYCDWLLTLKNFP